MGVAHEYVWTISTSWDPSCRVDVRLNLVSTQLDASAQPGDNRAAAEAQVYAHVS